MLSQFVLVFQFPFASIEDYDRLIELEERMTEVVRQDGFGEVDGHDAGSGEANIFIFTPRPRELFDRTFSMVASSFVKFKVAFRAVDGEEYTVLHPEDGGIFIVV